MAACRSIHLLFRPHSCDLADGEYNLRTTLPRVFGETALEETGGINRDPSFDGNSNQVVVLAMVGTHT